MSGKIIPGEDAKIGFAKVEQKEISGANLDNFSQAISQARPGRTSEKYLNITKDLNDIDESGDYLSEDLVKKAIQLSYRLYELDGVLSNTVDTYVEFTVSDFKFSGVENKSLLSLLEHWKNNVNKLNPLIERGLISFASTFSMQWYLAGNNFVEPKWKEETLKLNGANTKKYKWPSSIHLYDPQKITIDEFSSHSPVMVEVSEAYWEALKFLHSNGREKAKALLNDKSGRLPRRLNLNAIKMVLELPDSIVNSFDKSKNRLIHLDTIRTIQRKKAPWNIWGTPYTTRAFKSLAIKHRLQSLDMDTIEGLINLVTIFKIGDKDRPASAGRIAAFAGLMNNPARSKFLVWAHDVSTETIGPEGKIIDMTDRYRHIDNQILEDLGLPPAFTRSDKSAGDPWVQILRVMERISKNRKSLSLLYEDIATEIAEKNGFTKGKDYTNISVVWKRNNLMNPGDIREFVIQLYDRGLITKTTAIYLTDGDFEEQISQRISELNRKKVKIDGEELGVDELLSIPNLPFSKEEKVPIETQEKARRPSDGDVLKKKKI